MHTTNAFLRSVAKYYLIRAEILLPRNNAFRDSCAGPFLGFVQKYKILREIYTSSLLKKHQILVQKTGYGFGGSPPPPLYGSFFGEKGVTVLGVPPPFTDKIRKVVFDDLFRQKGGYGFAGYPPFPPLRTKSAK